MNKIKITTEPKILKINDITEVKKNKTIMYLNKNDDKEGK